MMQSPYIRCALDIGEVRIGLAQSDPWGMLATPVKTFVRKPSEKWDMASILRELLERHARIVYCGLPRTLKGKEGGSAGRVRAFAESFSALLAKECMEMRLVDERLSTVEAHRRLREAGMPTRRHRTVVDQVAAVGILQYALDLERSSGGLVGERIPAGGLSRDGGREVRK